MTIDILGLGESLKRYEKNNNISIGVNDINKFINPDYVVCVDKLTAFNTERLETIKNSNCKLFYSYIEDWKPIFKERYVQIEKSYGISETTNIFKEISHSITSVFVACTVAIYYFKPTELRIYGADFNTHWNLSNPAKQQRVIKDFSLLQIKCNLAGIKLKVTKESILSNYLTAF